MYKFKPNKFFLRMLPVALVFGNRVVLFKGSLDIPFIVFVILITTIYWRIKGQIQVEAKRLYLYLLVISLAIFVNSVSFQYSADFSVFSLIYLLILYFPVIFIFKNVNEANTLFKYYQRSMMIIGLIGILQFITQLIGVPYRDWLLLSFPQFIGEFNTSIPLFRGSSLFRSNGLFLLEPSFYSQYLAIAILLDLFHFKYFKRLPIFLVAILLSFSGTGVIILLFGLIANIPRIPFRRIMFPGFLLVLILVSFFTSDFGSVTIDRLAEFGNQNSSAYNRFIAPFESFKFWYAESINVFIFGGGAGSIDSFRASIKGSIPVMHPNFFIKSYYEYGLVFGALLLLFVLYLFWGRKPVSKLSLPLFIMYAIVSSGLLNAQQLYFCYLLGMLFVFPKKNLNLPKYDEKAG